MEWEGEMITAAQIGQELIDLSRYSQTRPVIPSTLFPGLGSKKKESVRRRAPQDGDSVSLRHRRTHSAAPLTLLAHDSGRATGNASEHTQIIPFPSQSMQRREPE